MLLFPNLGERLSQSKSQKKHHTAGKHIRMQQTSNFWELDKQNYDWIKECKLTFSSLVIPIFKFQMFITFVGLPVMFKGHLGAVLC